MGPDGSVLLLDGDWLHHGIGGDEAPRGLWAAQPPLSRNPRVGRAFKTHFILEYLAQPELRRRVRQGLLKSEQLHALARSVFYGKLGRADWRDFRRQMSTASCLLTILAAVVYWQIREIERVLGDIDPEDDVPVDLLSHISPISWDNVVLYGEYKLRPELVETGSA